MIFTMDKVLKAGQTAQDSMVTSHKERRMGLALISGLMAPTTLEIGRITRCGDRVLTSGLTGESTLVNG